MVILHNPIINLPLPSFIYTYQVVTNEELQLQHLSTAVQQGSFENLDLDTKEYYSIVSVNVLKKVRSYKK